MITVPKSRHDTHVMSVSELSRRLNIPPSKIKRAKADRIIQTCGWVGFASVVALTDDELELLRAQLSSAPVPPKN